MHCVSNFEFTRRFLVLFNIYAYFLDRQELVEIIEIQGKIMEYQNLTVMTQEPITLGSIVNPSLLWACYPPGVKSRSTLLRHQIDEELNGYFSVEENRTSIPPQHLRKHTRVSVRYYESWYRGIIVGIEPDGLGALVSVLLVDAGVIIDDFTDEEIFALPKKAQEYEIQAFLIALLGIVPLSVEIDISAGKTVLEPSQRWGAYQYEEFKNLMVNHEEAYFKTVGVKDNVRHGILYITKWQEKLNVNQILVEAKLAVDKGCLIDVRKYLTRNKHYKFVLSIIKYQYEKTRRKVTSGGEIAVRSLDSCYSTSAVRQLQTPEAREREVISEENRQKYYPHEIECLVEGGSKPTIISAGYQLSNKTKSARKLSGSESASFEAYNSRYRDGSGASKQELLQKTLDKNLQSVEPAKVVLKRNDKKASKNEKINSLPSIMEEELSAGKETKTTTTTSGEKPRTGIWNHIIPLFPPSNNDDDASSCDESDIKLPPIKSFVAEVPEQRSKNLSLNESSLKRGSSVDYFESSRFSPASISSENAVNENLYMSRILDSSSSDRVVASTTGRMTSLVDVSKLHRLQNVSVESVQSGDSNVSKALSGGKSRLELLMNVIERQET